MTETGSTGASAWSGRAIALSGLLLVQVVGVGFFLSDVIADLFGWITPIYGLGHSIVELVAVIALIVGTSVTAVEVRKILNRQRRIEAQLRVASGAFVELVEEHFDRWGLTPSERDVAMLAIKGLSIAEIAEVRRTREGTVKAQCNAIYGKAGVSGRQQLLSLFIDELMGEALVARAVPARAPAV